MKDALKTIGVLLFIFLAYGIVGHFDYQEELRQEEYRKQMCEVEVNGYHPPRKLRIHCEDLKNLPVSPD